MRKLASIQIMASIDQIPGAEKVELGHVLGWTTLIQRGQFRAGEQVVFCEIDSVLPDRPEFAFMKQHKFRVRTMKSPRLGVISQGIAFPMGILPQGDYVVGQDVTEALGITKYEPPIQQNLSGITRGLFPYFIPKTDQTRIQVLQPVLTKYAGQPFIVTEKLDGTSATYYIHDGAFGAASRNLELVVSEENKDNLYVRLAGALSLEQKMRGAGLTNHAIQGEIIGPKLHGDYGLGGPELYIFDIFNIGEQKYLNFPEVEELCERMGLKTVPVLSWDYELENNMELILKRAEMKSTLCPTMEAEGIVLRKPAETIDGGFSDVLHLGRVSFKAININYLVEEETKEERNAKRSTPKEYCKERVALEQDADNISFECQLKAGHNGTHECWMVHDKKTNKKAVVRWD